MRAGDPGNEKNGEGATSRFERIVGAALVLCVAILAVQFGVWTYRRIRPPALPAEPGHVGLEVGEPFPVVGSLDLIGSALQMRPAEPGSPATVLLLLTTTCPFCRANVPTWNELQRSLDDQVRFLGLSLHDLEETSRFVESARVGFPLFVVEDPRTFITSFGLRAVPLTLVIDAEGVIQGIWVGGLNEDTVANILQALGEIVPGLEPKPLEQTDHAKEGHDPSRKPG